MVQVRASKNRNEHMMQGLLFGCRNADCRLRRPPVAGSTLKEGLSRRPVPVDATGIHPSVADVRRSSTLLENVSI